MPPFDLEALQRTIQRAARPAVWSRAVQIARDGEVIVCDVSSDEIELSVVTDARSVARTVSLYPDDDEWCCDCEGRDDPCEHVPAALIAYRAAEGNLPSESRLRAHVSYHFWIEERALHLERRAVGGAEQAVLDRSLALVMAGKLRGPAVDVSPNDLEVERVLDGRYRGRIPRTILLRLFRALSSCRDIALEGAPVSVSARPLLPQGLVTRDGDALRLVLRPGTTFDAVFANGAVRCGNVLHPLGDVGLSRDEMRRYTRGVRFEPSELSELLGSILPDLRRRIQVDVEHPLPSLVDVRPRLVLDTTHHAGVLTVEADLVYGEPPIARFVDDRLTLMGREVPRRDVGEEDRLRDRLRRLLGLTCGERLILRGEEAVVFVSRLRDFEANVDVDVLSEYAVTAPLEPQVSATDGVLDVSFSMGSRRMASERVFTAWRQGASLVRLDDGGWAPLPADWLARYGARIEELLEAKDASGALPPYMGPDVLNLCDSLGLERPEGLSDFVDGFAGITPATLPQDLTAELRVYQREAVDWLSFLRDAEMGALLADDMGLGKTVQALSVVSGRTLVVAPTSVIPNWQAEAARFRPELRVSLYHGPKRRLDPEADLTLTTYAILRLDAERLQATTWDVVILDEAHAIKNPSSQVARAAHGLKGRFRLGLTGTPVENRLEELWSQFHFLNRGLLGTRKGFQERYARPIATGSETAAARLRARLKPFLLRRLKREVATELPPKTELVRYATLSPDERDLYDAVCAATREDVIQTLASGRGALAALEALLRLRQAACHPALLPGQTAPDSAKTRVLMEMLEELHAEGHKALVFSQWTSFLDLVTPHLDAAGIPFLRLDGATRDRGAVVDAFQDPEGPPVLLVSLKAGGVGLNLTAADHVFLLDPWWNPAVEDQATDRAHRIGQERPVFVHRLVATNTVEERILTLQESKRALSRTALASAGQATSLTRDDLLELLA